MRLCGCVRGVCVDNGLCLIGLCFFVYEVVAMALVVEVMKFGGVMVVGWFSYRLVCDRGEWMFEGVGVCCCGCGICRGRCPCGELWML